LDEPKNIKITALYLNHGIKSNYTSFEVPIKPTKIIYAPITV